ncbi:MAG: hypothetical protein LBM74_06400 [Oscillospiraceae bacterium]|jgi:tetratricopeptide (TPR) repeat protein|nr:hypothetical protein [Oscillospiraceae bacterium]
MDDQQSGITDGAPAGKFESEELQKANNRTIRLVTCISVFSLIAIASVMIGAFSVIRQGRVNLAENWTSLLSAVLPLVGGGILALFSIFGMNRLKSFDEKQESMRRDIQSELFERMKIEIQALKPNIKKETDDAMENLGKRLGEFTEGPLKETQQTLVNLEKKFGSIDNIKKSIGTIRSVENAHKYVQQNADSDDYEVVDRYYDIINRVQSKELTGTFDDYHNLSVEFSRQSYTDYALLVAKTGVEKFPSNIDLISDCAKYATEVGETDVAKEMLEKLNEFDKSGLNWRAFTFYVDALNSGLVSIMVGKKEDAKVQAEAELQYTLSVVEQYEAAFPYEDKAYMAEFETYRRYGKTTEALDALKKGVNNCVMAPQCAGKLAERYLEMGDFDNAILAASKAIIGNATAQPGINTGAIFAFRGLARDAQIQEKLLQGVPKDTLSNDAQSAVKDLESAQQYGYAMSNISTRISIINNCFGFEDQSMYSYEDFLRLGMHGMSSDTAENDNDTEDE